MDVFSTQVFEQKVHEVEQELNGNSASVKIACKFMRFGEDSMDEGVRVSSSHTSLAVMRVLAYKILDIVQWLNKDNPPSLNLETTRTAPIRFLEILVGRASYMLVWCG